MRATGIKLTDKDFGWKDLGEAVLKLEDGAYTLVGVQGREAAANVQNTSMTLAALATIHEFGKTIVTRKAKIVIPARSFIAAAIDEYKDAIQKRATAIGRGVVMQVLSTEQALEMLGEYAVGIMRQRIADGIAPPNRPSTERRKGSSKPLVDSGHLRAGITHRPEVR